MKELILYNFFPKHMNLYGDRGNVNVLKRRCEWRNIKLIVRDITDLDHPNLSDADLIYLGGAGDREQHLISQLFGKNLSNNMKEALEDGAACLAICGGYQLLGDYYETIDGTKINGINMFDYYTKAHSKRLVGDVLVDSEEFGTIIGFENHSGQTFHQGLPLGKVKKGYGNNIEDQTEGYRKGHFIGTYLHGPLLPKNPTLADQLIKWGMERKYGEKTLLPLAQENEEDARNQAITRIQQR